LQPKFKKLRASWIHKHPYFRVKSFSWKVLAYSNSFQLLCSSSKSDFKALSCVCCSPSHHKGGALGYKGVLPSVAHPSSFYSGWRSNIHERSEKTQIWNKFE
jgi:hypothetical protein